MQSLGASARRVATGSPMSVSVRDALLAPLVSSMGTSKSLAPGGGEPLEGGTSAGRRDAHALRAASGWLAKRRFGPVPMSGLPVPEARPGRFFSSASTSPKSKPPSESAPGAANGPATGGEPPAHLPPFRLTSFGGPPGSILRDTDDFFQNEEVLQEMPKDRLITAIPGRTHLFPDLGRQLFRSSVMIPFVSHRRKKSCTGVFKDENVGVIEELNVFGLKEWFPYDVDVLTEEMMRKEFKEARDFAIKKFEKKYGKGVLDQFPAIGALNKLIDDDTVPLDPERIVNNVAFLSKESTAILDQRMYFLLLKVIPFQYPKLKHLAKAVFRRMPYMPPALPLSHVNEFWLSIARKSRWLPNWIDFVDRGEPNEKSSAIGLLKHHRHGCSAHWMEKYVRDTLKKAPQEMKNEFKARPIKRVDVLDLYSSSYPAFTSRTYDACRRVGLAPRFLDINDLFHSPTCYS